MSRVGHRLRQALLVASALALQACAAPQVVKVEQADSERPVELKTGQILEVRLFTLPGRGLTLFLGSAVTPTLVQEGLPTHHDDPIEGGVSGATNYEAWRFRAVQPGRVKLRMDYRRQWDNGGAPVRSVDYDVVVR